MTISNGDARTIGPPFDRQIIKMRSRNTDRCIRFPAIFFDLNVAIMSNEGTTFRFVITFNFCRIMSVALLYITRFQVRRVKYVNRERNPGETFPRVINVTSQAPMSIIHYSFRFINFVNKMTRSREFRNRFLRFIPNSTNKGNNLTLHMFVGRNAGRARIHVYTCAILVTLSNAINLRMATRFILTIKDDTVMPSIFNVKRRINRRLWRILLRNNFVGRPINSSTFYK